MTNRARGLAAWALALGLLAGAALAEEKEMAIGDLAPDFALIDQSGKTHTLAGYRERWVVLYFYPKDDTPGCTKEACNFRDEYVATRQLGAEVLGVSVDDTASHAAFAKKYSLPFPLLADPEGKVARQYGALMSLGFIRFARRHTFLIDPAGRIAKIYRKVDPATHSREVLRDLETLQRSRG